MILGSFSHSTMLRRLLPSWAGGGAHGHHHEEDEDERQAAADRRGSDPLPHSHRHHTTAHRTATGLLSLSGSQKKKRKKKFLDANGGAFPGGGGSFTAGGGGMPNAGGRRRVSIATDERLSGGASSSLGSGMLDEEEPEIAVLTLSDEQKDALKTSWRVIYTEMGTSLSYVGGESYGEGGSGGGVAETFLRLFEEFPASQSFFTHFRGTPVESLREDARLLNELQAHAVRVMQVVEKVIARMENPTRSTQYLLNLGKFHRLSGIPSDYFGVMGTIFLHAVRPHLEQENCWNEATEDAWLELFSHIARVMTHGHKYAKTCVTPEVPTASGAIMSGSATAQPSSSLK